MIKLEVHCYEFCLMRALANKTCPFERIHPPTFSHILAVACRIIRCLRQHSRLVCLCTPLSSLLIRRFVGALATAAMAVAPLPVAVWLAEHVFGSDIPQLSPPDKELAQFLSVAACKYDYAAYARPQSSTLLFSSTLHVRPVPSRTYFANTPSFFIALLFLSDLHLHKIAT
jgi:hypothetical protein